MKKPHTILIFFLLLSLCSFSQTDSTKTKLKIYSTIGISIGHVDKSDESINNFNKASFPSVEIGVMGKNISIGASVGFENMLATSTTRIFYELKTSISKSISSKTSVYGVFGIGAYKEKEFNNFIEYGAGFSYIPTSLGYFVQYSNWARTNYVSVGLMKTF